MDYRSLESKIRDLWIAEANRNTEIRKKVENVGRPKDNVKDETSKLAKQGEIKTKIIDEAIDGDVANKVSDKKAKKDTEMDDMDAKTIKGGKTEVDLNPKTDDSTENSTDEDKKSKKATNKENKQIGAKGVKEETMTDKLTFGSPQSLIDSIAEAMKNMKGICPKCKKAKCMCEAWKEETELEEKLVGGQKKIDKNHNGKIDAQDFKILKSKKKVEEAYGNSEGKTATGTKWSDNSVSVSVHHKGKKEVFTGKHDYVAKKLKAQHGMSIHDVSFKKAADMKEEVEEIDERNIENKAKKDDAAMAVGAKNRDEHHNAKRGMRTDVADKIRGREVMQGKPRTRYEEVELSAEELARIEEIASNIDEVVTARKLTPADKAARAKWLAGHKAKMASYAPNEVKADAKSFKARNTEPGNYEKEPSQMHKTGLLNVLTKQDTKVSK